MRNRRVGASSRAHDPLGAGLYIFSGVRWLDPDSPSEINLLRRGLTNLVSAFPQLADPATLDRLAAILRRNRSEWDQTAWRHTPRRRRPLAHGDGTTPALPELACQSSATQEGAGHCQSTENSSILPAGTDSAFFLQDLDASSVGGSFQIVPPPVVMDRPETAHSGAARLRECSAGAFASAPCSALFVSAVTPSAKSEFATAASSGRPVRPLPTSPRAAPPSQRAGPWRADYGDTDGDSGPDDSEARGTWPIHPGVDVAAAAAAHACLPHAPSDPPDPAAAAADGDCGLSADSDGLVTAWSASGADRLDLPPAGDSGAAWDAADWLLPGMPESGPE